MNEFCFENLSKEGTEHLELIYREYQGRYVSYLDELGKKYGKSSCWWLLPINSRNAFQNDTFELIAKFEYLKSIVSENKYDVIRLDNASLAKTLGNYCKNNNLDVNIESEKDSYNALTYDFRYKIKRVKRYILKNLIPRILAAKKFAKKIRIKKSDTPVIYMPVMSSAINDGILNDRYFTKIQECSSKKMLFCPELIKADCEEWSELIGNVADVENYSFIFLEHYSHLFDCLQIIPVFRLLKKIEKDSFSFYGDDITPIIRKNANIDISGMLDILSVYASARRLFKKNPSERLILWYEARPTDIAISYAYQKVCPNGCCVGYIGYPMSFMLMGQGASLLQQKKKVTPNILTATGKCYIEQIKRFNNKQDVIVAPCFRNRYAKVKTMPHNKTRILVCLSYFIDVSRCMLNIVGEAMQSFDTEEIELFIKNHPDNAGYAVEDYGIESVLQNVNYVDGVLRDSMKHVDIAFSGKSTAGIEFVFAGIPLLYYCEKGAINATFIPEELEEKHCYKVYDADDFAEAVKNIAAKGFTNDVEIEISDYFVEPNKENTAVLLG